VTYTPVDIIWIVDNSGSMVQDGAAAQITTGLNDFANLIASKNLDYKVILLSLRGQTSPSGKVAFCIPQPLAGDAACGNGPRFFHSSMDVLSTQVLEFFLGSLGQTAGYRPGDSRESEPWAQELRPGATRTIVAVSDDNSRLTADQFEHFVAGANPFNSSTLPDGILMPSWNGLFDGFKFSAIYGWGSDTDPNVMCTGGTLPPASSGPTYTDLVTQTGGVRAKICDGAAAWGPFYDSIATAVKNTAKLNCELDIPVPPGQVLDPKKVNVEIQTSSATQTLFKVTDATACDATSGGWYYDNDSAPKKVELCQASCDQAQQMVDVSGGSIQVLFGCATIIK
jgi:hypothetical protein